MSAYEPLVLGGHVFDVWYDPMTADLGRNYYSPGLLRFTIDGQFVSSEEWHRRAGDITRQQTAAKSPVESEP